MSYEILMPFGKYKDLSLGYIKDSDPNYLKWLAQADGIPKKWKEAAMLVLHGKSLDHLGLKKSAHQGTRSKAEVWCIKKDLLGVRFDYDKELLSRFKHEIDGRKWNNEEKHWEFPAAQLLRLIDLFGGKQNIIADDDVKKIYTEEVKRRKELDQIRVLEDTDIKIDTKLDLYPYQKVAVQFAERAGGRAMIADQMGLGKTATAIGYAVKHKLKTIVVCPKSVVPNWMREIERFTGKKAVLWDNQGKYGRVDAQYHVIHYDAVSKHVAEFNKIGFDLLVCDEATYLKNRNTIRSKSVLGFWKERRKYPGIKAKHCLFLTGTPVLNRPVEAYHLLHYLDSNRFADFFNFINRYGGWRGEEPKNLNELHERTKDLVIRRLKKDVLNEMPPKQRNKMYVAMTPEELKEYNEHLRTVFKKWNVLGKPTVGQMPGVQKYLLNRKLPIAMEMVDNLLAEDRGILIFSVFVDPLKFLKKHYGDKAAIVIGEMSSKDRQNSIDKLTSGEAKIGLFSLGAGSMGIDGLQRQIDTVLFLDHWWVPSVHEQAEDRVHRIGQNNHVQIYYMICENTMDEHMSQLLEEKLRVVELITDGKLITAGNYNKSYFKEFFEKLRQDYREETKNLDVNKIVDDDELPQILQ
jgi:SWI/SNF-related matrix-associated actin-dependent regulator 1 of chromatin subfamily A